ncbi:MAG: hypothetical protein GX605_02080 [Chloroflexi bacterium]|nr:hypothetical protein [Chloroflexota bacterium]
MGRTRGCLWSAAGLVVALLAGFVGSVTLNRATEREAGEASAVPQVQVADAARSVPVRSALAAGDMALKTVLQT